MTYPFLCLLGEKKVYLTFFTQTGTLINSQDPADILHYVAFHQGLHCLQREQNTEMHYNLEISSQMIS